MSFFNNHKTGVCEKNKSLERAINERNCDEVKILISNGANVNHTVNQNLDTMLHSAKSAGIARDLLGYSADVNARNLYERTPLHSAVLDGKGTEMVSTLLQHGAIVDAKDSQGNTPLNYAVKSQVKNLDVIKTLVMNGASIGLKNSNITENDCSPLDNAFLLNDLPTIKALTAYSLLKKATIILKKSAYQDLSLCVSTASYYRCSSYQQFRNFLRSCNNELNQMRTERLNDKITLLQAVVSPHWVCESLGNSEDKKLFVKNACEIVTNCPYLIYRDVIFGKLKVKVDKSTLIKMLPDISIYTEVIDCSSGKSKVVSLNSDVTSLLAKYLSSDNLFSLILAYYEPNEKPKIIQSIGNLSGIRKNTNKRSCEATLSSCSKYLKKEN